MFCSLGCFFQTPLVFFFFCHPLDPEFRALPNVRGNCWQYGYVVLRVSGGGGLDQFSNAWVTSVGYREKQG